MSEPTLELKRRIINAQMADWEASRYSLTVQHRVQARIGGDAQIIKSVEEQLAKCEMALDALEAELNALESA